MVWLHLFLLAAARLAMSGFARADGFVALSDDDYSRAVIAEGFASSPHWDPSGTSWLPFPFWITGGIIRIVGGNGPWADVGAPFAGGALEVAWWVGVVLSVLSVWLLYAAGRALGLSSAESSAGALLACALPPAAALGSVAVPELPTASLCAFALLVASRREALGTWHGWAAACAVLAGTLSRYEAWPVAVVVAIALSRSAMRAARGIADRGIANRGVANRAVAAIPVALALTGPIAWLAHNHVAHGHALHFLARVSHYRAALEESQSESVPSIFAYALRLLAGCPPAMALVLAAVGLLFAIAPSRDGVIATWLRNWRCPFWGIGSLFAFLVVGAVLGGAPTHHEDRALLLAWLLAPFAAIDLAKRAGAGSAFGASPVLDAPSRSAVHAGDVRDSAWRYGFAKLDLACIGLALAIVALYGLVPSAFREVGVNRRAEVAVGGALAKLSVLPDDRFLLATDDYGYFAIEAALARPPAVAIDQTHDPRLGAEPSALADPDALRRRLDREKARWLVAPLGESTETVAAEAGLSRMGTEGKYAIWHLP